MCGIPNRYFIIITMSIFAIGFMAINDLPGSLQHAIMSVFSISAFKFSLLFSVAAWPSCFSFINGFLIDRYLGIRLATFIYIIVLTTGNALFLVGSFIQNYSLILAGRVFYGLGADPLSLCMSSYIIHWFASTNELSVMFAIMSSSPWIGSSIVFFMSNRIHNYVQTNYPLSNALGIAVLANFPFSLLMALCGLILALTYKVQPAATEVSDEKKPDAITDAKPSWRDIMRFPILFWLIILLGTAYYLALMTFLMMSQDSLSKRYKLTLNESSNLSSTFSLITFVLSPAVGFLIDKVGRNLIFATTALLLGILGHGIMAYSTSYPYLPVVILSISYSLMSSSYLPLISFLVEKHQTNTAFGIAQSGINGSFAIGCLIVGHIVSKYGYMAEEKFYCYLLLGTLPLWIFVWMVNFKHGNKLCLSAKQKLYSEFQSNDKVKDDGAQAKTVDSAEGPAMTTPPIQKKHSTTDADSQPH